MQDLFQSMEECAGRLVATARELKAFSSQSFNNEDVEKLQNEQETLVEEIGNIDKALRETYGDDYRTMQSEAWQQVQDRIDLFQTVNDDFVRTFAMRRNLVQLDIQEIRKSRKVISEVRDAYADRNSLQYNKNAKKRSKINTLS